jgi:hypothetical protein
MTEQALPARFAFYRKNTELFEIFKQKGAKIVFEDPLGVPLWHVVKKADLAVKTRESTIGGGRLLSWTYVGAALVAAVGPNAATGHLETIPIVQFSKNTYLPHSIRGVRTIYRDGLRASYFGKKYIGQALKPVPEPTKDINKVPEVKQEQVLAEPNPIRKRRIVRVPAQAQQYVEPNNLPYDDEDPLIDESKGLTCLAALALFFITCFYAHYTNNHMKQYNFQNFEEDIYWGQFP